jgi:hypothetical protein
MIDDRQWQAADEIDKSHPHWMVIWGCYSRMFWAFPRFDVPEGTIVSAADQDNLVAEMHRVEAEVSASRRRPAYASPTPAATLPQRSHGTAQRDMMSVTPLLESAARRGSGSAGPSPSPQAQEQPIPYGMPPAMPGTPPGGLRPASRNYDPYVHRDDAGAGEPASYGYVPSSYDPDRYEPGPDDPDRYEPGPRYAPGPYEPGAYGPPAARRDYGTSE